MVTCSICHQEGHNRSNKKFHPSAKPLSELKPKKKKVTEKSASAKHAMPKKTAKSKSSSDKMGSGLFDSLLGLANTFLPIANALSGRGICDGDARGSGVRLARKVKHGKMTKAAVMKSLEKHAMKGGAWYNDIWDGIKSVVSGIPTVLGLANQGVQTYNAVKPVAQDLKNAYNSYKGKGIGRRVRKSV